MDLGSLFILSSSANTNSERNAHALSCVKTSKKPSIVLKRQVNGY